MTIIKTILTTIFLISSFGSYAENKFQVIDKGIDGNQRQYLVTCTDGSTSSVTKYFELPEVTIDVENLEIKTISNSNSTKPKLIKVCIELEGGNQECRPTWELDSAAKVSCS